MFAERTYRNNIRTEGLETYQVIVKETDLWIRSEVCLDRAAKESIIAHRSQIEGFIQQNPDFQSSLLPWPITRTAPPIIQTMISAGQAAGVGPMAAVAGAIAEYVGHDLLEHSQNLIIENGGDVFARCQDDLLIALFAGQSPLSLQVGLAINASNPRGICTSSGTVGHSLSLGKADAVCILAESCTLADAAATAVANQVACQQDMQNAIAFAQKIHGIQGIVIIVGAQMAAWGDVRIVPLKHEKG